MTTTRTRGILTAVLAFAVSAPAVASAEDGRETIAVVDFDDRSGRAGADAGVRVAELLTVRLLEGGRYDVVDPSRVRELVQTRDPGSFDLTVTASAMTVGQMLGADKVVQGSIAAVSTRRNQFKPSTMNVQIDNQQVQLRLVSRVVDVASGKIVYSSEKVGQYVERTGAGTIVIDDGIVDELIEDTTAQLAQDLSTAELRSFGDADGTMASVLIQSTPPGADVILDNQMVGTAPVRIRLPSRTHNLKLRLAGYEPYTRTLSVRDGLEIDVPMKAIPDAERKEWVIDGADRIELEVKPE